MELCTHKRNKLKGDVEIGRNVFVLIKSKKVSSLIQLAMPKKCKDPNTFIVPCTISECTFAYAMLDLGASINVMLSPVYKSLNFDFYVLNMEDEPSSKTILMTTRTKKHPIENHYVFGLDLTDVLVDD
ncbi:hypothetical protein CR513_39616, partial [Mucuna pruriens]